MGFEPTTTNLGELKIDWISYKDFLNRKYNKQYSVALFNNSKRFYGCYLNPSGIMSIPASTRSNVLKALIALSKYQGTYLGFKEKLRQYGIKWVRPDNFSVFLSIMNNRHDDLKDWYRTTQSILGTDYKLFLRFVVLTGLRKGEAITSFNKIVSLAQSGRLDEYHNRELSMLEHYKYPNEFLRRTKNVYISILPNELVEQVSRCKPITYSSIHKFLERRNIKLRLRELRSYYASFMSRHNVISEEVDLLQGRVSKSVFVRHYLKENPMELGDRTLEALRQLEKSL